MIEVKMFFGKHDNEGNVVGEQEFLDFCKNIIANHFLEFTILPGHGLWFNDIEPCSVVIIESMTSPDMKAIDDICIAYCSKFNQESVLVTYSHVDIRLYGKTSEE